MTLLSMRAYAKHRGVSVEAVSKAVKRGRISTIDGPKGERKIDPAVADREWEENSDQSKSREEPVDSPQPTSKKGIPSYQESRAIREAYQARLAKIEYEERSGRLVDGSKVNQDAFKAARSVRNSLLSLPDRISAELAAERDQFKVRKRLDEEIRQSLQMLADYVRGLDSTKDDIDK